MCSTSSVDSSLQCTDLHPPLCPPTPVSQPFAVHSENTIINTWLRTQESSQEPSLYEKRVFWVVRETGSVDTVEVFDNFFCFTWIVMLVYLKLMLITWTLLFYFQGSGNLLWVSFCFWFVWGFCFIVVVFCIFLWFFSSPSSLPLGPSHASSHSLCTDWNFTYKLVSMLCENVQNPTTSINTLTSRVPVLLTMALLCHDGAFWPCFGDEGHLLWRIIACITETILSQTKSFIFTQRRRKWLERRPSS